jgi:hypothetical protein
MLHRKLISIVFYAAILFALPSANAQRGEVPPVQPAPSPVWTGIGFAVESEITPVDGTTSKVGLRVTQLPYGSPAGRAGVLIDVSALTKNDPVMLR